MRTGIWLLEDNFIAKFFFFSSLFFFVLEIENVIVTKKGQKLYLIVIFTICTCEATSFKLKRIIYISDKCNILYMVL